MTITAAKCTQCNANIQVDSSKDAAICEHCNTPFIVEKAINLYNMTVRAQTAVVINTSSISQDFEIEGRTLKKYHGDAIDVVIPEDVLEIGDNAFRDCGQICNIILPEGLKKVGKNAFTACAMLERIKLPESLYAIPLNAFRFCHKLKQVDCSRDLGATILFHANFNWPVWYNYPIDYGIDALLQCLVSTVYPFHICSICGSGRGFTSFRNRCIKCGTKMPSIEQQEVRQKNAPSRPKQICTFCGHHFEVSGLPRVLYLYSEISYTCPQCKRVNRPLKSPTYIEYH